MLSDAQIERYCRQIILPGFGSGGQERLLGASVAIHGDGDAAVLCASYLAGAGVGTLAIRGFARPGTRARALGVDDEVATTIADLVARRNADCRVVTDLTDPTLAIALDDALPASLPASAAFLWATTALQRVRLERFSPGRGCLDCVRALGSTAVTEDVGSLATLAALEALRILTTGDLGSGAELASFDIARGTSATTPFPSRPGCHRCSQGERLRTV